MKKHSYLAIVLVLAIVLCLFIPACSKTAEDSDIVIVYTTDVHCGVDDNIGYASLAAYVKKTKEVSKNFTLIDAGDAMQGNLIGSLSKGKYIIDIMNALNYDLYAVGNHEFDYGVDELSKRIDEFNGEFISCNLSYTGKKENEISKNIDKVYLSLGNKEKYSKNAILKTVEDKTKEIYNILGNIKKVFEENEGNHFQDANIRVAKGIKWILE